MKRIDKLLLNGLPKSATHVFIGKAWWDRGSYSVTVDAFKYNESGVLLKYTRDSDGEYPNWCPAIKQTLNVIPVEDVSGTT